MVGEILTWRETCWFQIDVAYRYYLRSKEKKNYAYKVLYTSVLGVAAINLNIILASWRKIIMW